MKKIFLNLTTVLFLAFVTGTNAYANTFQTGNDNFTSLFISNGNSQIVNTTFSTSYLNAHPNMDSFWLFVTNNRKPDAGIQLFGDFNSNIITALPYSTGNDYTVGQIRSNTIFDNHYVAPNIPWNTETTGSTIATEWLVTGGDINVKDAARSIPFGYVTGKTSGKHIDLDGQSAGTISKTMATEIGKKYTITFEHTPSPAVDNVVNPNWTEDKPFKVKIGDKEYDFVSSEDKLWKKEAITFTATSENTDISFISGSQGTPGSVRTGAYLDDIKITQNNHGEPIAIFHDAMTENGFSIDISELIKISDKHGLDKFEAGDKIGILYNSGSNADIVYHNGELQRYHGDMDYVGEFRSPNTAPVSEPVGLLVSLTALSFFALRLRRKSK